MGERGVGGREGEGRGGLYMFLHRFCISFLRLGLIILFQTSIVTCVNCLLL